FPWQHELDSDTSEIRQTSLPRNCPPCISISSRFRHLLHLRIVSTRPRRPVAKSCSQQKRSAQPATFLRSIPSRDGICTNQAKCVSIVSRRIVRQTDVIAPRP